MRLSKSFAFGKTANRIKKAEKRHQLSVCVDFLRGLRGIANVGSIIEDDSEESEEEKREREARHAGEAVGVLVGGTVGFAIGLAEKQPMQTDDVDDGEDKGFEISM